MPVRTARAGLPYLRRHPARIDTSTGSVYHPRLRTRPKSIGSARPC